MQVSVVLSRDLPNLFETSQAGDLQLESDLGTDMSYVPWVGTTQEQTLTSGRMHSDHQVLKPV